MARQDSTAMSVRLAAAQEQLHQRRQQRRQERLAQQLPVYTDTHGRSILPQTTTKPDLQSGSAYVAGWESDTLTRVMRASGQQRKAQAEKEAAISLCWLPELPIEGQCAGNVPSADMPTSSRAVNSTITVHPDLAVAMLRNDLSSAGRLWLLLRHLDDDGRGWVSVTRARKTLTQKESPLRICGWRQLRNLLGQGDNIFWKRDSVPASEGRIWLRSTAKVAAALDVRRLSLRPVTLPLSILLEGIGSVRAHLYASYHSGRESKNPIARQTLTEVTGVARRSQRNYEEKAGVKRQHNWAVGNQYSQPEAQQRAWQHGHAIFQIIDHRGKAGTAGKSYLAWQLPNSYAGPHAPQAITRKKRINRRLVDLFNQGITGNSRKAVETKTPSLRRDFSSEREGTVTRFYEHGEAAARSYNRRPANDLYWRTAVTYRQYRVWHVLPGTEQV